MLFILAGAAYTSYRKIVNTGLAGSWSYTEYMPIIPVLNIGAAPLLQWIVIPPVLLWLMRAPIDNGTLLAKRFVYQYIQPCSVLPHG